MCFLDWVRHFLGFPGKHLLLPKTPDVDFGANWNSSAPNGFRRHSGGDNLWWPQEVVAQFTDLYCLRDDAHHSVYSDSTRCRRLDEGMWWLWSQGQKWLTHAPPEVLFFSPNEKNKWQLWCNMTRHRCCDRRSTSLREDFFCLFFVVLFLFPFF